MYPVYKVPTEKEKVDLPTKQGSPEQVHDQVPEDPFSFTDYSQFFRTDQTFESLEEAFNWAQKVGKEQGMVIVRGGKPIPFTSDGGRRLVSMWLCCERYGKDRPSRRKDGAGRLSMTSTKRCECPFRMHGYEVSLGACRLDVSCGEHNHQLGTYKDDPMKSKPRQKAPVGLECRGVVQQFRTQLAKSKYFERHRTSSVNPEVLSELFFAHPESVNLLRAFPHVLIIDATCVMCRHDTPVFQVMGITSEWKIFTASCTLMSGKTEDNYLWVLNQVQEMLQLVGKCPTTIVMEMNNMDLPLLNAVDTVFPHTKRILSRSHIYENIKRYCVSFPYRSSEMNSWEEATALVSSCRSVFEAKTEDAYRTQLFIFEYKWRNRTGLVEYVKQTWLNSYKERIVSAWTDNATHFGTHSLNNTFDWSMLCDFSSRTRSSMKRFLMTFSGGFRTLFTELHSVLELQIKEIDESLKSAHELSLKVVNKMECFNMLRGRLSHKAFGILVEEYKHATRGVNLDSCDCALQVTHGLPCRHIIAKYVEEGRLIEPDMIHEFWRTLDFGEVDELEDRKQYEERILQTFMGRFPHFSDDVRTRITEFMYETLLPQSVSTEELPLKKPKLGNSSTKRKVSQREYEEMLMFMSSPESTATPFHVVNKTASPTGSSWSGCYL